MAKREFQRVDNALFHQLTRWARFRHPRKHGKWCYQRYWRNERERIRFSDGTRVHSSHQTTTVSRFVKVQHTRSPYDGDWVYWATRLGRDPAKPRRVTRLLKRQRGHCAYCGLRFNTDDVLEVHHHDRNHQNNAFDNLRLLHGHCHDVACPERSVGFTVNGADDHSPYSEEPDKAKVLRPVRSGGGVSDGPADHNLASLTIPEFT